MKKTRPILHLSAILLACMMLCGLGSCGTTRAHFGLDHDVAYNWNGGYFEDGGHSHKHKHKKPKPPKHKKHKKHKEHHHH